MNEYWIILLTKNAVDLEQWHITELCGIAATDNEYRLLIFDSQPEALEHIEKHALSGKIVKLPIFKED